MIIYYKDEDGDRFGDPANFILSDFPPPGWVTNNTDCDDTDDSIHPDATEIPDGIDNDCDGEVDEDLALAAYYADNDQDGYGNPADSIGAASPPPGYVTNAVDCDDTDPGVYPGAVEVFDGKDNDCDGLVDENLTPSVYYLDSDGDDYGSPLDSIMVGVPPPGYVPISGDCDDTDAGVNPGAVEVLDGKDNNCDGQVDEGLASTVYYADNDGDGYGTPLDFIVAAEPPPGYVSNFGDCHDADSTINPGAFEILDDTDHNCNGAPHF